MINLGLSLTSPAALGAAFTPARLFSAGEVGVWYDPSDISTLFTDVAGTTPVTAAGQEVARIIDKSGRGNHATQGTLAARPIYRIDAGGRPYLEFDGTDDSMVTGTITPGADKVQVFAGVRKILGAGGWVAELSVATSVNNGSFYITPSNGGTPGGSVFVVKGTAGQNQAIASNIAAPVSLVLTGIGDISGDLVRLRQNAVLIGSDTDDNGTGNFGNYPLYIGMRGGVSLPLNGHIYGLIVRFSSANLGDAQIANAERWLNRKTGAY